MLVGVGTGNVPAAADARWRQEQTSDKGILKGVLNIIDVIAHKWLVMNVWEQAEIDRTMVETPDGTKRISSANATLAISTTVCRAVLQRARCLSTRTSRDQQANPQTSS